MNVPGNMQEEPAWWMKYGARGVGCGGGIIAIGLGAFACISLSAYCIVAGIWQMFAGFIVVSAEAPCCCLFIDFVDRYSKWVELRPSWQKAALYVGVSLPPFIMCFSLSTFLGSGLIFLSGALYGMMSIGKKGKREDMLATAQSPSNQANSHNAALVDDPEAWRSS